MANTMVTKAPAVSQNELAAIWAELKALREENASLKAGQGGKIVMKVSPKGALSLYGLGRFPITAYATQWQRILGMGKEIEAFMERNKAGLKWGKDQD
jgi:hypothetical protein